MTVLLDTHALIWYASDSPKLSKSAKEQINAAESVLVCAISAWEIGMLVGKERLALAIDVEEWIRLTYKLPKVKWISLTPETAVLALRIVVVPECDPIVTASDSPAKFTIATFLLRRLKTGRDDAISVPLMVRLCPIVVEPILSTENLVVPLLDAEIRGPNPR